MQNSFPVSFLLCSERSGSNLITKMLDSHPRICGPSPSHMIRTFCQNILRYGDLSRDENWMDLLADVSGIMQNQLGEWRSGWSADKLSKMVPQRSLAAIIRTVYEEEARRNGKDHIFIKENRIYNYLPYLLTAFPESRFIYLVRDPRDMVLSWKRSANHPGAVIRGTEIWKEDQSKSILIYGYLQSVGRIFMLRYEDLIENPGMHMQKLCAFLQLPYDERMLQFHEQDLTIENARKIKDWENLGRPVLTANKKKYIRALSELEISYIEASCEAEMQFFGYHPDFAAGDLDTLMARLQEEEKNFTDRTRELSPEEEAVRNSRLDVIRNIINRRRVSPFSGS